MSQMDRVGEVSAGKTGRSTWADRVAAVGVDLKLVVPARSGRWSVAASRHPVPLASLHGQSYSDAAPRAEVAAAWLRSLGVSVDFRLASPDAEFATSLQTGGVARLDCCQPILGISIHSSQRCSSETAQVSARCSS
jgi:hypothetical protein